ncbi:FAD-dependent monooxygenase [Rhizobium hidalgonense]|uniref:FAD-dependent monooxygenase n=1 Tax=Rhizobium hidalgonense TaxID=1538159 RepID=A0A2A6KIC1_9HYPH|nr:FAD-dependent monooxygenase [Rhizobium hidalgonense]MDR9774557.1 FAD-dependent monooxygenase [Rhizobium hidalgonense]MDR9805300.1 FAD-dependent monooxygenase [Rhizobium hidalgonense]MDR9809455.1 FAD-dependent monooxygenase [Rhizobium hidalgonense]MDR9820965.1 FAD-dependent monooxygenase [Rhizobium hidalgonense]PDT24175.1 salicylate hydroxylase [Rhizobium hidalgonense]
MPVEHAAIIGAGISGLTAALSLSRRGISSDIFEQAGELTDIGAGLQVSPNASRILAELGILEGLSKVWLEPETIRLISGSSLRQLTAVPAGTFARQRWGAPYGVLHRSTLQKALLAAVEADPLCRLHLGIRMESNLPAIGRDADVVIGADGVWSKLRQFVPRSPSPRFSGNIAYRFTIAETEAPDFLDRASVCAFLGGSAHLVCYPLREIASFNMVAITAGNIAPQAWQSEATAEQRAQLFARLSGWNSTIVSLLERHQKLSFWPLFETTSGTWQDGRKTVLIGDAAHAMMPFAAQGAAMAIEDGYELAAFLSDRPAAEALKLFESHRAPRIAKLRQRGAFNRFAYHAKGPIRIGRDLVLGLKPPQSLATDLDWIYGYRALRLP